MSSSDSSSLKTALSIFQTHSISKLVATQIFPVFIGRFCELLVVLLSFGITFRSVPGVSVTDVVNIFAALDMFQFRVPQALWDICQQKLTDHSLADDAEACKQQLFVTLLCGCTHSLVLFALFYPVAAAMCKFLYISKQATVQLHLIVALSNALYTFSLGFQNIYQIESRFLLIFSLRAITAIAGALIMLCFVVTQGTYSSTLFIQLSQHAALLITGVWVTFWNRGQSILNITNKTVIAVSSKHFATLKGQLKQIFVNMAKQLGAALVNFIQQFNMPLLIFISTVTVNEFSDAQGGRKAMVQSQLFFFYVFGQLFKASSFSVQQICVFDVFIFLKQKKYTQIIKMQICAALCNFVINSVLLLVVLFSDVLKYFIGGNAQLLAYFATEREDANRMLLFAYAMGVSQFFQDFQNAYLLHMNDFLMIFVLGASKLAAGTISIFLGYKFEYEMVNMLHSYMFSESVGVLTGVYTFCFQLIATFVAVAAERRRKTQQMK